MLLAHLQRRDGGVVRVRVQSSAARTHAPPSEHMDRGLVPTFTEAKRKAWVRDATSSFESQVAAKLHALNEADLGGTALVQGSGT